MPRSTCKLQWVDVQSLSRLDRRTVWPQHQSHNAYGTPCTPARAVRTILSRRVLLAGDRPRNCTTLASVGLGCVKKSSDLMTSQCCGGMKRYQISRNRPYMPRKICLCVRACVCVSLLEKNYKNV